MAVELLNQLPDFMQYALYAVGGVGAVYLLFPKHLGLGGGGQNLEFKEVKAGNLVVVPTGSTAQITWMEIGREGQSRGSIEVIDKKVGGNTPKYAHITPDGKMELATHFVTQVNPRGESFGPEEAVEVATTPAGHPIYAEYHLD